MRAFLQTTALLVLFTVGQVRAQTVLFDFDNAPLYSPLPINLTVGGITAHFSANPAYYNYSIQRADVLGFTPAGFAGYCVYPSTVYLCDLLISFDRPLTAVSIMYAPEEYATDSSCTMRITAYLGSTFVGTNTYQIQQPGTWPTGILSITTSQPFDNVVIHYDQPPPTGGDYGPIFMADNLVVTPAAAPVPLSAASRKVHGAAGTFDVNLPLTGAAGIECRAGGATNDYSLVVTFANPVTLTSTPQADVTTGVGTIGSGGISNDGIVTIDGATVTVPLTNVADAQTIAVTLFAVNDGAHIGNVVIPMSFLIGDVNGNGTVNASDVTDAKAHLGQQVTAANFRGDINANGGINAVDVAIIKGDLGTGLP
jgi:hypothetical protein